MKIKSDWSRHEFGLDLRGSYSEYDKVSSLNRPLLDLKATRGSTCRSDTTINTESRLLPVDRLSGQPEPAGRLRQAADLHRPTAAPLGLTQRFNHLEVTAKATADRTQYQTRRCSTAAHRATTTATSTSTAARVRASYEVFPGVKPFAEVGGDTRKHDLQFDRDGLQRDSQCDDAAGRHHASNLPQQADRRDFGRLSWPARFEDPRLAALRGVVADASLIWDATGLTTVTLTATSRGEETVLAGVSGALRRDIGVQVDHALRRWLIWSVRAGYGIDDYKSIPCECNGFLERVDKRTSLGTVLTYKISRELALKGEYRYDQLRSNTAGVDYNANVFLIGLKLQR